MTDSLAGLKNDVHDESTFIRFMHGMAKDRAEAEQLEADDLSNPYGMGHNGWANGTIVAFLEAAAAWAETSSGQVLTDGNKNNTWKRVADILYAGKAYE